jgi:hypothetical protein
MSLHLSAMQAMAGFNPQPTRRKQREISRKDAKAQREDKPLE